jgi:hypothetical protein
MAGVVVAPTFTLANRPAGYDQTQRRFGLSGALGLAGYYTNGTGVPIDFTAIKNTSGTAIVIPPTYTGANGPGQAIPLPTSNIQSQAGYTLYYDTVNHSIRIFAGTTEASTGAIPSALLAATIAINVAGTLWTANDTFTVAGQTGMVGKVITVSAGVPTAIQITIQGAPVAATAAVATAVSGTGTGLTVDITVAAGIPATFEFLRG